MPRQFYTHCEPKFSNLRPLLSITFPKGFQKSKKKFGHWTLGRALNRLRNTDTIFFKHPTLGNGGKKTLKWYLKNEHNQTHTDTHVGIKCLGRIVTKCMSYFLHLCDSSVPYCASLEAWNWVGAGQHIHASHPRSSVWPIPNVTLFSGNYF